MYKNTYNPICLVIGTVLKFNMQPELCNIPDRYDSKTQYITLLTNHRQAQYCRLE